MTQAAPVDSTRNATRQSASERNTGHVAAILCLVVVAACFLVGHLPLLKKFLQDLGNRQQYEFYPLIVAAAVFLAWDRLRDVPAADVRRGTWWIAGPLLALSLTCSLLGAGLYLRWFAGPAAVLTLAAIVWRLGGSKIARALLPAGVLLLVIIPPPFRLDNRLTRTMQRVAVETSSGVLDLVGQPHVKTGNVIEIPGHRLLIEEACSGINSLMSVLAFTIFFACLKRRQLIVTVSLLCFAAWVVLWCNVARITVGAVLQARYKINILDGSLHQMSGLLLFGLAVALVASADQLLLLVNRRRSAGAVAKESVSQAAPPLPGHETFSPRRAWPWCVAGILFVALGTWSYLRVKDCWPTPRLPGSISLMPPAQVGEWRLMSDQEVFVPRTESFGRHCHRWIYQRQGKIAEVALAYPFLRDHDPAGCYSSFGWSVQAPRIHKDERDMAVLGGHRQKSKTAPYFEIGLSKLDGSNGHLLFAAFDEAGNWDVLSDETQPAGRLASSLWISKQVAISVPRHEVQALVVSKDPLSLDERVALEHLFLHVRQDLAAQTLQHLGGHRESSG